VLEKECALQLLAHIPVANSHSFVGLRGSVWVVGERRGMGLSQADKKLSNVVDDENE